MERKIWVPHLQEVRNKEEVEMTFEEALRRVLQDELIKARSAVQELVNALRDPSEPVDVEFIKSAVK